MNASELHALVEPIREVMIEEQTWPQRGDGLLYYSSDGEWKWCQDFGGPVYCHHDDAANAITVALLRASLDAREPLCASKGFGIPEQFYYCGDGDGPTPLHALVAWYTHKKGLAQ